MDTYTIERLGHRGDGIAPGPVFAARTLPGEVIAGDAVDGRIAAPRILTPSPERVKPACPHYNACGGCALMHARDAFVTEWKSGVVHAALAAQGLSAPFLAPHVSPPGTRRRAALSGTRTKKGAIVGFHGRASDTITSVPGCLVLDSAIVAGLPALEALVRMGASRKGELSLTVTVSEGGLDVAVRGGKPLDGALRQALAQHAEASGWARIAWEGEVVAARVPAVQRFGVARVVPPPGAFLQATREGEGALLRAVARAIGGARRIADLFAGCGTFTLPLAARAEVHAVEGSAEMLAALDAGWRKAEGLKHVTTEARDLFRRPLLADELARFDAVVFDPPRAGAAAQVAAIAASGVPRVAAVSCNPVTFARDARALADAGYALAWVQVVDQFRWSPHVELAALFHLGNIGDDATRGDRE